MILNSAQLLVDLHIALKWSVRTLSEHRRWKIIITKFMVMCGHENETTNPVWPPKEQKTHVGLNQIKIEEPSFLRIMMKEFSRTFYVYQNFITSTWLNYAYWHMGIVNTLVYTLGGLVVSLVQYQNDLRLQELCKISGTVEVLRDGKFVEIEQKQIVPDVFTSLIRVFRISVNLLRWIGFTVVG